MKDLSAEQLVQIEELLDGAIASQRKKNLSVLDMVRALKKGPAGWDDARKVNAMSILLSVAIQRLVMHEVMNDESGSGELDWPEGFLPGEA